MTSNAAPSAPARVPLSGVSWHSRLRGHGGLSLIRSWLISSKESFIYFLPPLGFLFSPVLTKHLFVRAWNTNRSIRIPIDQLSLSTAKWHPLLEVALLLHIISVEFSLLTGLSCLWTSPMAMRQNCKSTAPQWGPLPMTTDRLFGLSSSPYPKMGAVTPVYSRNRSFVTRL